MSKNGKRLKKLFAKPTPSDMKWKDFVSILESCDFKLDTSGGGSHFNFEHVSGRILQIVRSHPTAIVKQGNIKRTLTFLGEIGISEPD